MAIPKKVIKKALTWKADGRKNKEIASYMYKHGYIKSENAKSFKQLMWKWNKKYFIINGRLMVNKEYEQHERKSREIFNARKNRSLDAINKVVNQPKGKSYTFWMIHNNSNFPKGRLCKINNVSYSGYKAWVNRGAVIEGPKYDNKLLNEIERLYYKYNGIYGVLRIKVALEKENGIFVSKNTVHRYMKKLNLKSVIRKKRYPKERKDVGNPFKNVVRRNFSSTSPFQKLFTDVSYIFQGRKLTYLSIIIDSYNNKVVAWNVSLENNNALVMKTLEKIESELINNDEVIIHSDRGSQYTSHEYMEFLSKYNITQSTSRLGNSLDNRPAEYFFSIIKSEMLNMYDRHTIPTGELISKIKEYINFYNKSRPQSSLGWKTPNEVK